jgi:hypothetical protein
VSWDEQFAWRYDEWSVAMTEDVPFYVSLRPTAMDHSSNSPSAMAVWRFLWRSRPAAR